MSPVPIGPGGSPNLKVAGKGGVPSTLDQVSAVVLNVTVTDTSAFSCLTVFPTGFPPQPMVSNLNWASTQTVANLAVVALGSDGSVTIVNDHGQANVIFDVAGWVGSNLNSAGPEGMFHALTPSRLLDTRTGAGPLVRARRAPSG